MYIMAGVVYGVKGDVGYINTSSKYIEAFN